ncbi:hypothetical protein BGX26_006304 [Mortierella sp. AD094]|nr:hypothetical protein BGX26_006304 [Mortierella sp. AD094]
MSSCTRPAGGFHNVTEINADGSFCTMLPLFGSQSVTLGEPCANSANYAENVASQSTQIAGCMNGAKWGLNPTDVGGQIDFVGWQYIYLNSKKFVSLLDPITNQYCIRC